MQICANMLIVRCHCFSLTSSTVHESRERKRSQLKRRFARLNEACFLRLKLINNLTATLQILKRQILEYKIYVIRLYAEE